MKHSRHLQEEVYRINYLERVSDLQKKNVFSTIRVWSVKEEIPGGCSDGKCAVIIYGVVLAWPQLEKERKTNEHLSKELEDIQVELEKLKESAQ